MDGDAGTTLNVERVEESDLKSGRVSGERRDDMKRRARRGRRELSRTLCDLGELGVEIRLRELRSLRALRPPQAIGELGVEIRLREPRSLRALRPRRRSASLALKSASANSAQSARFGPAGDRRARR